MQHNSRRVVRRNHQYSSEDNRQHNPMFQKQNWKSHVIAHFSTYLWLIGLAIVGLVYLFGYSPVFTITTVSFSGSDDAIAHEIHDTVVQDQLTKMRFLIFPQRSILTFDAQALRTAVEDQYSFESVTVEKSFFHQIDIRVTEKNPELVWYTTDQYYFLDQNGSITGTISDVTTEANGFAHVIDESNTTVNSGQRVLTPETVSFVTQLHTALQNIDGISVFNYTLPTNLSTQLTVRLNDVPYVLYFDTSSDRETQIAKLQRVITEGVLAEKNPQEYVDVRIGDRVYFK